MGAYSQLMLHQVIISCSSFKHNEIKHQDIKLMILAQNKIHTVNMQIINKVHHVFCNELYA